MEHNSIEKMSMITKCLVIKIRIKIMLFYLSKHKLLTRLIILYNYIISMLSCVFVVIYAIIVIYFNWLFLTR